jgi:hypothetical protein
MIIAMSRSNASFTPWILTPSAIGMLTLLVIIYYVLNWFRMFRMAGRRRINPTKPQRPNEDLPASLLERAATSTTVDSVNYHDIQSSKFASFPSMHRSKD